MDPIARRVAWVDVIVRQLAGPPHPAAPAAVWAELTRDPLERAQTTWEHAGAGWDAAANTSSQAPAVRAKAGAAAAIAPAAASSAMLAPRSGIERNREPDVSALRGFRGSVASAAPPSARAEDSVHAALASDAAFKESFLEPGRHVPGRLPMDADAAGSGRSSRETVVLHQAALAVIETASGERRDAGWIATPIPPPSLAPAAARARESGVTRLTRDPGALARLLEINRAPAAVDAAGTVNQGGSAPLAFRSRRGDDSSSSVPVSEIGAHDPVAPRPDGEQGFLPAIASAAAGAATKNTEAATSDVVARQHEARNPGVPIMEAILDELADRLRLEFMREYGTSAF
jgi:hypothetical protein